MSVVKTPNGRFRAKLKVGRVDVASRVFDTRRAAVDWLARERAALDGGVDPRAGKQRVRVLVDEWLTLRWATVATKTARSDEDVRRLTPSSVLNLHVAAVSERETSRTLLNMAAAGRAEASIRRYRASLSSFFAWCVQEKLIPRNPVTAVPVPKSSDETTEMHPFTETELEACHQTWAQRSPRLADIALVLGWTGLRWAEMRAMEVGDVLDVPTPALWVRRSMPEGVERKATKGRRSRRVPLANRVLGIVQAMGRDRDPGELLFVTDRGAQLHRNAFLRTLAWNTTGGGRRIHDLRHTAACLWLARGVDPGTVQAWMGHESIATTNRYLHYLGTSADLAGLARLNRPGGTRGARGHGAEKMTEDENWPETGVSASQSGLW